MYSIHFDNNNHDGQNMTTTATTFSTNFNLKPDVAWQNNLRLHKEENGITLDLPNSINSTVHVVDSSRTVNSKSQIIALWAG